MEMAVDTKSEAKTEVIQSMCGICPTACGIEATLVDGKLDHIRPLEEHPMGMICRRGEASVDIVYAPDRLQYPMKRVGKRGEGKFERLTWDQALDEIAARLQEIKAKHGGHAIADYSGRGGFEQSLFDIFAIKGVPGLPIKNFPFPLGSPNATGCTSICYGSYGMIAPLVTYGTFAPLLRPDLDNTEILVLWGANPATDSPPMDMPRIRDARKRGAKVISIDHLANFPHEYRDEWIPVRPGSDGALALSMINVVIEEELYDKEFVDNWTVGFAELRDYVKQFTPEEAERLTWVPADTIRRTARAIGQAKGASFLAYTGLEYADSGVQNIRAVHTLFYITGNFDAPGGMLQRMGAKLKLAKNGMEPPKDAPPAIGSEKYPLFYKYTKSAHFMEFPKAILEEDPYPIKALILQGANILTGYPNPDLWKRCYDKLDLLVCIDRFMTKDAPFADYVLPATTYYEIDSFHRYPAYVQLRQKVVEPQNEARNDYLIYAELAKRLGYGHLYPQSEKEMLEFIFSESGVTLEELREHPEGRPLPTSKMVHRKYAQGAMRRDKEPGFPTPSGKFEITSSILEENGYDALPVYVEPSESPLSRPDLAKQYPLVLNSGARVQSTFRSQHLNIPQLVKMRPFPELILHEDDARERGIADGDKVVVFNHRGEAPYTAKVTTGVCKGAVEAIFGGGGVLGPKAWQDANINVLSDENIVDPISGFPVVKALLCNVRKAT